MDPIYAARSLFMENSEPRRQQIVDLIGTMPAAEPGTAVIELLVPLRLQLASLVSEDGFNFLFDRTLHQTAQRYRWIGGASKTSGAEALKALRATLMQQTHEEALAAGIFLLLTFIELVASLIGEPLTDSILRSAWGNDALGTMGEDHTA
jgi:hypothetical protein